MGRTILTFNGILEAEYNSWLPYRRALRKEDKELFDTLFRFAKKHVAESGQAVRAAPFEAILLSMLIEQQREIQSLAERLRALEEKQVSLPENPER